MPGPSKFLSPFLLVLLALGPVAAVLAAERDAEGCHDHPLLTRYPGAVLLACQESEFDEYFLVVGPRSDGDMPTETVAGRITRLRYAAPADRSVLEVFHNYQSALDQAGFEFGFGCARGECGHAFEFPVIDRSDNVRLHGRADQRYLSARLARPEGDLTVALYIMLHGNMLLELSDRAVIALDIIESQPMEEGLIRADPDAEGMALAIEQDGRVALYGIHFAHGQAAIMPESADTLNQIAALLQQRPQLRLLVVGHTDNTGSFEFNLRLSRQRAEAVVAALVGDFGVDSARLDAHGVAFLAPVADNRNEHGRALNRRVELVPQRD